MATSFVLFIYSIDFTNEVAIFINQKLEACLGIRITPTSKGSSMKYEINRLFVL